MIATGCLDKRVFLRCNGSNFIRTHKWHIRNRACTSATVVLHHICPLGTCKCLLLRWKGSLFLPGHALLILDVLGHAPDGRLRGVDIAGRVDRDALPHGPFGRVSAAYDRRRSSIARVKADCRRSNEGVERCVLQGLEHPI